MPPKEDSEPLNSNPEGILNSTPHAHLLAAFQGPDLARRSHPALPAHALPHLLQAEFLHPELHDRHARVVLVLVVRADPVPRHQVLRDLDAARDAGVDVAAHVPGVFDAVEAVDEGGERKGGVRDEVVRGVRDQVRGVRDTVRGVEEGESFGRAGLVVTRGGGGVGRRVVVAVRGMGELVVGD